MGEAATGRIVRRVLASGVAAALLGGMATLVGVGPAAAAATLASTRTVVTIAGNGTEGTAGNTQPASGSVLNEPTAVAVDHFTGTADYGDIAIAESGNSYAIRVIAGTTGTQFGKPMTAGDIYTVSSGRGSTGLAFESTGNLVFTNTGASSVGIVHVANGSESTDLIGIPFSRPANATQVPATGTLAGSAHINPIAVAVTPTTGNILFTDQDGAGGSPGVRYLAETTGTYFGKHVTAGKVYTLATTAGFGSIQGIAVDPSDGNVLFSVQSGAGGDAVWLDAPTTGKYYGVTATAGTPVVVAGKPGTPDAGTVAGATQDGAPATGATLQIPDGLSVDSAGNLLIADSADGAVRVVAAQAGTTDLYGVSPTGGTTAGDIYTIAGTGGIGPATEYAPATSSEFDSVTGVAVLPGGTPVLSDSGNQEVDELVMPTAPTAAPSGLAASPGGGNALVSWQPVPPATDGELLLSDYVLRWFSCTAVGTCTSSPAGSRTVSASTASATVTGLKAGQLYAFTVAAKNGVGTGPVSSPAYATPSEAAPGPVTDLIETSSHGTTATGTITATWAAPANDGGGTVTGYTATISPCSTSCTQQTVGAGITTATFTTLTNGATYSIAVAATNSAGTGPSTSVTGEPTGVPGKPVVTGATPGDGSVTLDWSAPGDAGSPITGYVVQVQKGATAPSTTPTSSTGTSYTVTGLTDGTTYTFSVKAVNANGTGPLSTVVSATPVSSPAAPTHVHATPGLTGTNPEISVTWTKPTAHGTGVTGYVISVIPTGGGSGVTVSVVGATSLADVVTTGLAAGTTYDVTVAAAFTAGKTGPPSSPPVQVTTDAAPGAPVGVVATSARDDSGDITLTWAAPTDHGTPIEHYSILALSSRGTPLFTFTTTGSGTSYLATGAALFTPGDTYAFVVSAVNAVGQGSPSAPSNQATSITAPTAPTVSNVDAATADTDGTVTLTWTAPATNGAPITKYTVTPSTACAKCTGLVVTGTPAATSTTIGGLTPGSSYTFKVKAANAVGASATSGSSNPVTPKTAPDAPTKVHATPSATGTEIQVTWTDPASANGTTITGYDLVATPTAGGTPVLVHAAGTAATTGTITGLAKGTTYDVTVAATFTTAGGTAKVGPPSSPPVVVTTASAPGAPSDVVATSATTGSGDVTLTWGAPADNGAPIDYYTVIMRTVTGHVVFTFRVTHLTTTAVVLGTTLTPGTTYAFTMNATNAAGTGATSAPSNPATSATAPAAPTNATATANPDGTVTLTWTAPATNGAPITKYTVTPSTACATCTSLVVRGDPAGTSTTITGLTLGQSYTFTVAATNEVGTSTTSTTSNTVTPATPPSAPTNVTAYATATSGTVAIFVTWTAPATNGSAIASYTLTAIPVGGGTTIVGTLCPCGGTSGAFFSAAPTGIVPGVTYDVTVTATNGIGTGPASSPPAVVTADNVPGAPSDVVATSLRTGSGSIGLTWAAPTNYGGSLIDWYTVSVHTTTGATVFVFRVTGTTTTAVVTGATLTPGTTYYFTVDALNTVGFGPASAPSNQATSVTAPAAPTAPTVAATPDGTVTLTWAAPATHGATVTSYTVTPTPACPKCTGLVVRGNPAGTTTTVSGLTLGTKYHFTVTATNAIGPSGASPVSLTVTPATPPSAPTKVTATATATSGIVEIFVTWTAAVTNGSPVTSYTVTAIPVDGGTPVTATTVGSTSAAFFSTAPTGVQPGVTYYVVVTATNAVGTGPAPALPAVVETDYYPGAPRDVVATSRLTGSGSVALTWAAAAGNGSGIDQYTVTARSTTGKSVRTFTVAGTTTSATVKGATLAAGDTYTFTVDATNTVGAGPASAPSNQATSVTEPAAPTAPAATAGAAGSGTATLTWSEPAGGTHGAAVTSYTVTPTPACPACTGLVARGDPAGTTTTVTGLTPGTAYHFTVTATNEAGTSAASGPSATVTPEPEQGYWIGTTQGGVYTYGGAAYYGAAGEYQLNQPIVGMAATPDHQGYWQVAADGGIFAFGNAGFYGSTGSMTLDEPVVGMAPTADGDGYWLVAADGGVFAYGNAGYHGSLPGDNVHVDDVVGIVPTPDGGGYWMVGADGGVFAFGDAGYYGSLPGLDVHVDDIVAIVPSADGKGYWMVGADGGVFAFGDAKFSGSLGGKSLGSPIAGLAPTPDGNGYWLVARDGYVFTEGDATYEGSPVGALSGQTTVVSVIASS